MLEHLADHDRLGPWMEPYPDPAWQLIAAGYDPTREAQIEASFAISNGLLGCRNSPSRMPAHVASL
jgi:trehalose/maltose hydrolase-like predicted phosphorylase